MKILYVDTSSNYLYSGIIIDNSIKSEVKEELGKDLSKVALPKIIKLFDEASITPQDLDKIMVVIGPGSFTGVRIGVTIAKTIAWSLDIPIVPVSGLTAMALSNPMSDNYSMPLIDARRGYVYGALYDKDMNSVVEDTHIELEELKNKVKNYCPITVITNNDIEISYDVVEYNPDILKIVNYFKDKEGINPHLVNPIYLKKTEAEEKANL
jgi:universal bacterial protein yeaZ